jgi:hypothetical protein
VRPRHLHRQTDTKLPGDSPRAGQRRHQRGVDVERAKWFKKMISSHRHKTTSRDPRDAAHMSVIRS